VAAAALTEVMAAEDGGTNLPEGTIIYGTRINPIDGTAMVWVPEDTFTMGTEHDAW